MGLPSTTGTELLIINDPATPNADRSSYLHFGDGAETLGGSESSSFGALLKQRATATIALNARAGDPYEPTIGAQVFLYDISAAGQVVLFAGTIDKVQTAWWGTLGDRLISLSCVSFEQAFDTIRVPGRLYQQTDCGTIFTDLLTLAAGWPGSAGTISAGPIVDAFLIEGSPTIADIFDRLSGIAGFIWGVDPTTLQVNFTTPAPSAAPFALQATDVVWNGIDFIADRREFRDRQIITLDYDAFGRSDEVFVGAGQTAFALRNPVHDVTNAWITKNTQNTATGSFSGQPVALDTVTISYPTSGSIYNWAPNAPYAAGQVVIDPLNHRQVCTTGGISAGSMPTWNDTGGTTVDNTVRWHDSGDVGFGPYQVAVYQFVSVIDNTQYGQVLIGASAAATCQNLCDAINAKTSTRGVSYSMPTWENPLVDADEPSGTTFTLRNKYAGKDFKAALTKLCAAFSWSAATTSGGITTFGTYSLSVGISAAQANSLSYTPGSNVVTLFSPLNAGTNLAVEYHRIDGNQIAVENTPLVADRAVIENGTGKYQSIMADDSATPTHALAEAQAALSAFDQIPDLLEFLTFRPGLRINQALAVAMSFPDGPNPSEGTGDVLPTAFGFFGSLIGAWCDSAGSVVRVILLGDGTSLTKCPVGATQLQLGMNDAAFFDNFGSWVIDVNGATHTVPSTSQPWVFTGGINLGFLYGGGGGASDGTAPVVISGFTAGQSASVTYTSGLCSPGGAYAAIYDADGVIGTPADPAFHTYPSFYGKLATNWVVQEVEGELIPSSAPLGSNNGHWRYTVRCISAAQIASYLEFWQGSGGAAGSSGGGASFSGGPMPPTSSAAGQQVARNGTLVGSEPEINFIEGTGITIVAVDDTANQKIDVTISSAARKYTQSWTSQTTVAVAHGLGTTDVLVQVYDASTPALLVQPETATTTDANTVTLTFGAAFSGRVTVIG